MDGKWMRKSAEGIGLLALLWLLFAAALGLTARIPRSAIRPAFESNARYYESADAFEHVGEGRDSAVIHNYADAMLYNLIWSVDTSRPFTSALTAPWLQEGGPAQGLSDMVFEGGEPDAFYGRYWHGASVLVRPLSVITDIHGIRALNSLLLLALALIFGVLLCRRRLYALFAGYLASALLCKTYAIPLCMEYMPCFVIMLAFGSLVLGFYKKVKGWEMWFLASGALVCFFDFLTCEILTLFVPLICLVCLRYRGRKGCIRLCFQDIIRMSVIWLAGYSLTFLCKWLLVRWITGESLNSIALDWGLRRIAGNFYSIPLPGESGIAGVTKSVTGWQGLDAVLVNLGRVWPMNLAPTAAYIGRAFGAMALILFTAWFLFRKKTGDKGLGLPLLFIAFMPFLRWMALNNHSLGHPFFTFRDWFIILMALSGMMGETLDWKVFAKKGKAGKGSYGTDDTDALFK